MRVDLNCILEDLFRIVPTFEPHQGLGKIHAELFVIGLDPNGFSVLLDTLIEPSVIEIGESQQPMCFGAVTTYLNRSIQVRNGFLHLTQLQSEATEVELRKGKVPIQGNGLLESALGIGLAFQLKIDLPQLVEVVRIVVINDDSTLGSFQSLPQLACVLV